MNRPKRDDLIEVRGPWGTRTISAPMDWTPHDMVPVRELMLAAGYQDAAPTTNALLAFVPSVEADEVGENPFTESAPLFWPSPDAPMEKSYE